MKDAIRGCYYFSRRTDAEAFFRAIEAGARLWQTETGRWVVSWHSQPKAAA